MAFEGLQDKLSAVFKKIRSKGKLSESDVKDAMREVRLALLEADVNYQVAKKFSNACAEKCIGEKVMDRLIEINKVAYIRFASVYKDFKEVKDFEEFVGKISS